MSNTINNTQSTRSDIIINVDTEPKINLIIEDQQATVLANHGDDITLDVESGYENNYNKLKNKPSINGKTLVGDISADELGLQTNTASDVSYTDNLSYDVSNVQEALDKAFDTLDNKMNYEDFKDDFDQTVGDINDLETTYTDNLVQALNGLQREMEHYDLSYAIGELVHLETEDKSNIVNAINEVNGKAGIQEFVNQSINIYDLEPGIYLLSGINTKIYRDSYGWWTNPVSSATSKSILVFTRHAKYKEQGFLLQSYSASPYVKIIFFDGATKKEFNMMTLLTTNNSTSYSVTSSYQPAHKLYVDNAIDDVRKEVGGIIDLGWIDLDDGYDGDVFMFIDTIINEGKYKFTDSYDNFVWLVEVETAGNRIGQRYWYQEEGFTLQYHRDGWYNEEEDVYEWSDWTHYIDYNSADYMFARKEHTHYSSINTPNLRDFLNGNVIDYSVREYNIMQTGDKKLFCVRVAANNSYVNNTWKCIRYQEYYDIEEPSKIYKRTGMAANTASSANVTWGDWYVFEGTIE